ncbi:hypothetical protein [Caldanaerobacter subterraneus]|uniref:Holin n=1 Tax=Caldanaerobacter subterraneus TaxID=911092 RepID=A0A7Y2PM56_9THEO|nr:hypothetical protein [Caldanaerobacter subterraneus]NNG67360.1 hypothetical protein [Caldanaerobacter subterraneus]
MNPISVIDYGLAAFAVAGILYVITLFNTKKREQQIAEVIDNNTKTMQKLIELMQQLQISLVKQDAKIDELLERVRSGGK